MNISLTWADYALIVSVCLVTYYSIVVLLFYRKAFSSLMMRQENKASSQSYDLPVNNDLSVQSNNRDLFGEETEYEAILTTNEESNLTPDAQDFADEVSAYTSSCGDIDKDELTTNLRKIILKYPSLIHSKARYELSQLIAMSAENYCSIHLSAEEVGELWKE